MPIVSAKPSANQASRLFRELHEVFNQLPVDDQRVDILAADLSAHIAGFVHPVCLGLFDHRKLRKIYSLARLLSDYGVTLRSKRRKIDGMVFVYGEIELPVEVQFVGSFVHQVPQGMAA